MPIQRVAPIRTSNPEHRPKRWSKAQLGAAAGYVALLVLLAILGIVPLRYGDLAVKDLVDADRLTSYFTNAAVVSLANIGIFGVLGGLVVTARRTPITLGGFASSLVLRGMSAWLVTTGILILGVQRWPSIVVALPPLLGCALGVWIVCFWCYNSWLRLSLIPQGLALLLAILALAHLSVDEEPLAIPAIDISSTQKRRLVDVLRYSQVRQASSVPMRVIRLTQSDVNLAANWGLQIADGRDSQSKSQTELTEGGFLSKVSLRLPRSNQFVNVVAQGTAQVNHGEVNFQLRQLRLGRVEFPSLVLPLISDVLTSTICGDSEISRVLARTESLRVDEDALTIVIEKGAVTQEITASFEGIDPVVRAATIAQLEHLGRLPPLDVPSNNFDDYLQAAFSLASERTAQSGHRAVKENCAAIYALGILLGHQRLGRIILASDFSDADHRMATAHVGQTSLRGRRDWTQHFIISAALTAYANSTLSDAAGLLKEELDAGRGGSGFSFGDLLADHAGTRFAQVATRDETSALSMQRRLMGEWTVDDIFPPAADLPEGLNDAQLQQQFGGVGGEGYQKLIQNIESRLSGCQLLQ